MNHHLKSGDKIAIIAPSNAWGSEADVKKAQAWLKSNYDIEAVYGEEVYTASSASQRAQAMQSYLNDPGIKALWSFRGGEGAADVIPFLHEAREQIKKIAPKLLIGFSDFTVMLNYFNEVHAWPVVHGMGLLQAARGRVDRASIDKTMTLLMQPQTTLKLTDLQPINASAKTEHQMKAGIAGGTLSLLNISVRDLWEPTIKNKIIIIEDVNEKPHAISRTLKYLARIHFFKDAAAIIFGDFCTAPQSPGESQQATLKALRLFAAQMDCPVLLSQSFGHGVANHPFAFYGEARLSLGGAPRLCQCGD